jgi:hypothetical protein
VWTPPPVVTTNLELAVDSSQSRSRVQGRRKIGRLQSESRHLSDEEWESLDDSKSTKDSSADNLSNVLNNMSIKEKNGSGIHGKARISEDQSSWRPMGSIIDMRRRLVKKAIPADSESDSELDTFASPDAAAASPSVDYTSADDGDVDSPVSLKVKAKVKQAGLPPKPASSVLSSPSDSYTENEEAVFDFRIESSARGTSVNPHEWNARYTG